MSVSSTTNRVAYSGNGSSAVFNFPYYFFNTTDLKVYTFDTVLGASRLETLGAGYSVSGTPDSNGLYTSGANVVYNSSPGSTDRVIIFRDPPETNNYSLGQNATISSKALSQQLDYMTLLTQRLGDQTSRAVVLNDGFPTTFDPTLPANIALVGSSVLVTNGAGTGFAMGPTTSQIASAQSSASSASSSASASAAQAAASAAQAASAASSAVSAAASAVISSSSAASIAASVAIAQSSALSASNSAASAGSSALSASNSVTTIGSSVVSASNQAVLAGSAALSASNSAASAGSSALSALNSAVIAQSSAQAITIPVIVSSGGTNQTAFVSGRVVFASSATQLAGLDPGASGNVLRSNGSSVLSFGHLTPPKITVYTSGATTHTMTANVAWARFIAVGGGGGGSGSATQSANDAGNGITGASSSVGSSIIVALGGAGAANIGSGGIGGTATINTPATGFTANGNGGGASAVYNGSAINLPTSLGGGSVVGGGAPAQYSASAATAGLAGAANSGGGGGGGGINTAVGIIPGGGGGGGGYADAIIGSGLVASYIILVGDGGAGGTAGTSGAVGGKGGTAKVIVQEFF